jgi:hypothetical protein
MQHVATELREYTGRNDTEAPFGSRVSWRATWSGTITSLSVATLLWALALAIVALAMHPTAGSLRGAAIAGWICLMACIVVGSFFGGLVASSVRGSPRMGIGLLHGFITWGLTFVLGALFCAFFMRGLLFSVASALPDIMNASPVETGSTAVETSAAGRIVLDYLVGFGWSWFGTWFVALILSLAGAALGVRRARGPAAPEREIEEIPPLSPLTPAPSA